MSDTSGVRRARGFAALRRGRCRPGARCPASRILSTRSGAVLRSQHWPGSKEALRPAQARRPLQPPGSPDLGAPRVPGETPQESEIAESENDDAKHPVAETYAVTEDSRSDWTERYRGLIYRRPFMGGCEISTPPSVPAASHSGSVRRALPLCS